jgi:hypothetical protein
MKKIALAVILAALLAPAIAEPKKNWRDGLKPEQIAEAERRAAIYLKLTRAVQSICKAYDSADPNTVAVGEPEAREEALSAAKIEWSMQLDYACDPEFEQHLKDFYDAGRD